MSKVLPILFNTDMVQAILDGRKTVTRRVIKPYNAKRTKNNKYCQDNGMWMDPSINNGDHEGHIKDYSISPCWISWSCYIRKYAPYRPGDILYIRETHYWLPCYECGQDMEGGSCNHTKSNYNHKKGECGCYQYRADYEDTDAKWRPSIHMPKEAARIWLKVTDVRVERLQNMNTDDAEKEGLYNFCKKCFALFSSCDVCSNADGILEDFKELWDSTTKKSDLASYGWEANPWVWVVEFERCEKPVV